MCAPMVTKVMNRQPTPWMNDDLRNAMKDRNSAQRRLKDDRQNSTLQQEYKPKKNLVKIMINNSKSEHYRNEIANCKGKISSTWKVIEDMIPGQKHKSTIYASDNLKDKAEEFNKFFSGVGETIYNRSQQLLDDPSDTVIQNNNFDTDKSLLFRPQPVDANTVILTIKHLNKTRSVGSDGIPLRFLQDALYVIVFYITCIINTTLVTGKFPTQWKHANVIPVFKSGDISVVNNYRPISLLPILSKILEKIVANQLQCYLESQQLLSSSQHGFRPRLSTETALTVITNEIYNNMDQKNVSLLTLCDLSKAFNSVSHTILLMKCKKLNIDNF